MQIVSGKGKFQRQTSSNPGHLFTTGQVYSSLFVCHLEIKLPTLRVLSHRTWHRWVLNTEYLSDQFSFFKVRSKRSFICHFPLVLGVFSCMGLELKCSSAGLTRRGGHISLPHSMEIWVSCLCNLPAAPWTSMWYLTSYRQAAQVRVGRRQGMASANSNATSSELIQCPGWGYYTRRACFLEMSGEGAAGWYTSSRKGFWFICLVQRRQDSTCLCL